MSTPQDVLTLLKRDELLAAVDRAGLSVADRRKRDGLATALAGSVPLASVLEDLSRVRLKQLCREVGLDDGGREKAVLVGRLAAAAGENGATASPTAEPVQGPLPLPVKLTRVQLERHLWAAADILRGTIDSSDYKNYILGLLFLKRVSDRFEEECEALRAEGHDPEDPDEHEFFVPKGARWPDLQRVATHIGEALNKAAIAIEDANGQRLEGVLAGIDFNDERRLGDVKQRDSVLLRLVRHFSQIPLRNESLAEPDMLGRAYEYLIERFADDAGKKGGEFYTPHQVVRLMVEILDPQEGMRVCDPTCGSGGMLIQCAEHVRRNGGDPRNISLFGQEKNLGTWAICKMNLLLHGIPDAIVAKGDTIRDPKLLEDGALMTYDLVIANPPFSLDDWGGEEAEKDRFGRFAFGLPPKTKGDLAFVQHMIAILNARGRMAVVMSHGVLFRGSEKKIREGFVRADLLEAVIGLPPNLFYGTGIPAAILVMNRAKPPERQGKVLFVEASREYKEGSNQNFLRDEDVDKIVRAVQAFQDVEGYQRVVTLQAIESSEFRLNIPIYVSTLEASQGVPFDEAVSRLKTAEALREEARAAMASALLSLGYEI